MDHYRSMERAARGNVVDLARHRSSNLARQRRLLRLAPEHDGLSLLYSHHPARPGQLFAMKILCWGLRADGEVVGMVPWLNRLAASSELQEAESGRFEGFYDPQRGDIFQEPPEHKVAELQGALRFFGAGAGDDQAVQEIPDTIGTHALFASRDDSLILAEVLSWRLLGSGSVQAMLINEEAVHDTPVLPGDQCLYPAQGQPGFRYFFQHHIANQIKSEDPEAMAAIAVLFEH